MQHPRQRSVPRPAWRPVRQVRAAWPVRWAPRRPARPTPARPAVRRSRRAVRLTGLGCGVLATVTMVGVAWLLKPFGDAPLAYGVVFVTVCLAGALWVRPADLVCAPIAAPLAFTAGLAATGGLVGTVTELALRAPWLFAGTGVAAAIALLRWALLLLGVVLMRRRRRRWQQRLRARWPAD